MITREQLFTLGVDSTPWTVALNQAFERFGINNAPRQAMFLAQCLHESGGFRHLVESLNYSADALVATWPHRFTRYEAIEMARDEARIGERAYGGRMGNGPEGTGDGYRFRGRGIIQITGRENYGKCGAALKLNLLEHPELLEQPAAACMSAGWYWSTHGCNELADAGDFEGVTRRINGGLNGLADRKSWLTKTYHALGTQPAAPIEDRSPPTVGGRAGVQYSDPSTNRGQPSKSGQRKGTDMGAGLIIGLVQALIQGFAPKAERIVGAALEKHGVDSTIGQTIVKTIADAVAPGILTAPPQEQVAAFAAASQNPEVIAKAESSALDYLEKIGPLIDKIDVLDRTAFTDTEASRDAAARRALTDPYDPARTLTWFGIGTVGALTAFLCLWISINIWKGNSVGVEMWAALTGMIGWITAKLGSIFDNRFGTTRASAAKDVVIGELARRQ